MKVMQSDDPRISGYLSELKNKLKKGLARQIENSLRQIQRELAGELGEQVGKRGGRQIGQRLVASLLKRANPALIASAFMAAALNDGIASAARNAVIPVDLVEEAAEDAAEALREKMDEMHQQHLTTRHGGILSEMLDIGEQMGCDLDGDDFLASLDEIMGAADDTEWDDLDMEMDFWFGMGMGDW